MSKESNVKRGADSQQRMVSTPHETDWKALDAQTLKYRKEHFAVEVTPDKHALEDGQICLSVTNNGTQWTSISLLKGEVDKVIAALRANDQAHAPRI